MAPKRPRVEADNRLALGRQRPDARFPAAPAKAGLPADYADALGAIKRHIRQERLRAVLTANAAMVVLYWDIGRMKTVWLGMAAVQPASRPKEVFLANHPRHG